MIDCICRLAYSSPMKQTHFFQILSDETRLRALRLMADHGELCVCELVHTLEISQPKISRHMAMLREADIVHTRRRAQWVYYNINPDLENWQKLALNAAVDGTKEEPAALIDRKRLAAMTERPGRENAA